MRSFRFIPVVVIVLGFLFAVFFWRETVNGFFSRSREIFSGLFDGSFSYAEFMNLKAENAGLRATLQGLEARSGVVDGKGYKTAGVYSRYPWNDRRLIVIDLGASDGLKEGMPVLSAENVLLGRIIGLRRTKATVQTLFDPEWRESVALGEKSSKALLKGGLPPVLELISKEDEVSENDRVLNLSPEFPLHVFVGNVRGLDRVSNETWRTAELEVPYELDSLNQVMVVTDFP